jgi:hypothetical protein
MLSERLAVGGDCLLALQEIALGVGVMSIMAQRSSIVRAG